jgi:hypothetical protein
MLATRLFTRSLVNCQRSAGRSYAAAPSDSYLKDAAELTASQAKIAAEAAPFEVCVCMCVCVCVCVCVCDLVWVWSHALYPWLLLMLSCSTWLFSFRFHVQPKVHFPGKAGYLSRVAFSVAGATGTHELLQDDFNKLAAVLQDPSVSAMLQRGMVRVCLCVCVCL